MGKEAYVYILVCADGTLYTGWSTDPKSREKSHNSQSGGAKYTRSRRPVRLVYTEKCGDKSAALKRECEIKRLTHEKKLKLIESSL